MAAGTFELRKDAITGWWVAVVVDRPYEHARFARRARPVDDGGACQNCALPGDGVRLRALRSHAFRVAGSERRGREDSDEPKQQGLGLVADVGAWQTVIAPHGHHASLSEEEPSVVVEMLQVARDAIQAARSSGATDYVQVVGSFGHQAGALTNHACLDLYDVPQIPHRIGEELGGAARYVIRESICPFCRLVRDETAARERLVFEDAAGVAFAPYASRSPFELWLVPRRHQADFGLATDADLTASAEGLRKVLHVLDVALDRPPYNIVLHTAPLRERVDDTYHWHWEIHPRLREVGGLELGTGLPVNPICPETAVEELRSRAGLDRVAWPA